MLIILKVTVDRENYQIQCANGTTFFARTLKPDYDSEQPGMIACYDRQNGAIVFRNPQHEKACRQDWGIAA